MNVIKLMTAYVGEGGPGSGHFGHQGVKGVRGGSLPNGGKHYIAEGNSISEVDTKKVTLKNILSDRNLFTKEESKLAHNIIKNWYGGKDKKMLNAVRNFDVNKKNSLENDVLKKIYDYQQKYFSDRNVKSLKLYRGLGLKDKISNYNGGRFESWTSDKEMAEWFAKSKWLHNYKSSGVITRNINAKDILFSQRIYKSSEYSGSEFISKSGNFTIDNSNFTPFTFKRRK
jgi:hypothetical protein